jgi:hypothetical protein
MTNTEAKQIVANYQPHPGFFDLSDKPSGISKNDYAKILNAQNFLIYQNAYADYLKKHDPSQWEKLKEFAAELQQIILRNWKIEEMAEYKEA